MSSRTHVSSSVRTQFLEEKSGERYAYRRFGSGPGLPLLLLQHFTGTLDNWDPALTDALAGQRELILFDTPASGGRRAQCRRPLPTWRSMPPLSSMVSAWGRATCSDSRLAEWSPSKWCWTFRWSFGA